MKFSKWLFPYRRFLTENEKKIANSVFGKTLNVEHVEIVACRLILSHYALSPNGKIYFNPQDWHADFSILSIEAQSWLIHELVHVWQIQQGIRIIRKAIFNRRYSYILDARKDFFQYGVEQQAQMVQDWFIKSRKGVYCDDLKNCIPFLK